MNMYTIYLSVISIAVSCDVIQDVSNTDIITIIKDLKNDVLQLKQQLQNDIRKNKQQLSELQKSFTQDIHDIKQKLDRLEGKLHFIIYYIYLLTEILYITINFFKLLH